MTQHPPFFIVSLPRSRTAWLANLLTYGPAFCLHDALGHCERPEDLPGRLAATGVEFPGDADPSLPLFFPIIHQLFPGARYVFIERPADECRDSFHRKVDAYQTPAQTREAFDRLQTALAAMRASLANQYALRVRYEDLDDYATCQAIWDYCVPGVPFNPLRWELLEPLNVQVDVPKAAKRLDRGQLARLSHRASWIPHPASPLPVKGSQSHPLKDRYYALLVDLCAGNQGALQFLLLWLTSTLTWDHINDSDPLDKSLANEVFENFWLELPMNPFWQQHAAALRPALLTSISAWKYSNHLITDHSITRSLVTDHEDAWQVYTSIPLAVALLLGGRAHVDKFNIPLRAAITDLFADHTKEAL